MSQAVGAGLVTDVLKKHSISMGSPLQSANMTAVLRGYLENAALFFGLGAQMKLLPANYPL